MIAKISKGGSFGGAVDYVLDKGKDAELLAGLGVRMKDRDSIVRSFRMQAALNPHLSKPVGHIVLAFSTQDAAQLDNQRMVKIAAEYFFGMGIRNTQFIIARHHDREHPHLHILFNRVDNDGRTVSDRNDRYRSERLCKELTVRHGLYFASGKENVKEHRLREPDKTKYEIFHALRDAVPRCHDWPELTAALRREGIATEFRMRSGTSYPQGVVFAKNGYPFNGSKIDPAVQFLQNRPCAEPEPPTSTLLKRTRFCKQSGRIVQSPARRSSATGLRCGRRTPPSGATAQKEKTIPTLIDNTYYLWTRTRLSNFSKN